MAWYGRRRRGGFRRSFRRFRTRTRYVSRGYTRRRRRYNSGGFLGIRISRMHKNLLAGAVLMFVALLFLPRFNQWCFDTWVKLRLPQPK